MGNKILMRVKDKFVQRAAELLGLESAKTMTTPTTKEVYHKEGTNKLDDEEKRLVRQVVGMLHYNYPRRLQVGSVYFERDCIRS